MTERIAMVIWLGLGAYLAVGALIAVCVLTFGLKRLEPTAGGMKLGVRALVAPGMAALWPLILMRLAGRRAREDRA